MRHNLKTINPFFEDVWQGNKGFEIRKNDRGFKVDDELNLEEVNYNPSTKKFEYTGRSVVVRVRHILSWEDFPQGLRQDYVCMTTEMIEMNSIKSRQNFEEREK